MIRYIFRELTFCAESSFCVCVTLCKGVYKHAPIHVFLHLVHFYRLKKDYIFKNWVGGGGGGGGGGGLIFEALNNH